MLSGSSLSLRPPSNFFVLVHSDHEGFVELRHLLEDFPVVGQREWHAKQSGTSPDEAKAGGGGRKSGFFSRFGKKPAAIWKRPKSQLNMPAISPIT